MNLECLQDFVISRSKTSIFLLQIVSVEGIQVQKLPKQVMFHVLPMNLFFRTSYFSSHNFMCWTLHSSRAPPTQYGHTRVPRYDTYNGVCACDVKRYQRSWTVFGRETLIKLVLHDCSAQPPQSADSGVIVRHPRHIGSSWWYDSLSSCRSAAQCW